MEQQVSVLGRGRRTHYFRELEKPLVFALCFSFMNYVPIYPSDVIFKLTLPVYFISWPYKYSKITIV